MYLSIVSVLLTVGGGRHNPSLEKKPEHCCRKLSNRASKHIIATVTQKSKYQFNCMLYLECICHLSCSQAAFSDLKLKPLLLLQAPDSIDRNSHFASQNSGVAVLPLTARLVCLLYCPTLAFYRIGSDSPKSHKRHKQTNRSMQRQTSNSCVVLSKICGFVKEVWWLWRNGCLTSR